jgi:hypothetical protein
MLDEAQNQGKKLRFQVMNEITGALFLPSNGGSIYSGIVLKRTIEYFTNNLLSL